MTERSKDTQEFIMQLVDLLEKYTDWKMTLIEDDENPEIVRGMIFGDYELLYDYVGYDADVFGPPDTDEIH